MLFQKSSDQQLILIFELILVPREKSQKSLREEPRKLLREKSRELLNCEISLGLYLGPRDWTLHSAETSG